MAAHHGYAEEILKPAAENMHLNPMTPIGPVHPLREPMCESREPDMSVEAVHASPSGRNCFADRDHDDSIGVPPTRSPPRS
ncbi:hypothetical protein [Methylobacterium sp. WSM2598]|uniref:hypothetical protein n=1 Tax=Methylobacterium sp. WSM2598 TaxID=398261 RepID=UPI00039EC435|nr:hypothetical protein [Methylobacterium sp. WSM2598]